MIKGVWNFCFRTTWGLTCSSLSDILQRHCIPEYETIKSRVLYRIVQSFKKLLRNYQHNVEKYSVNGIQMTSEGIGNYMMTSEGINNYIFVLKLGCFCIICYEGLVYCLIFG